MNNSLTIRGFVALTSTLIMSVVLTAVTATLLYTSAQTRFGVESIEHKEQSRALARACIDQTLTQLVTTTAYQGNATTTNPTGSCYVYPINRNGGGDTLIIAVRSVADTVQTILVTTIVVNDVRLVTTPANTSRIGTETPTLSIINIREVTDY